MGGDIGRTRDELAEDRRDAACDQIGIWEVPHPYRAVEALCDEVDEAVCVAGADAQLRMSARHLGESRRKVRRSEGQRGRDAQLPAQLALRQDRFSRQVDFRRDAAA